MAVSTTLQRLTAVEREIKGLRGDLNSGLDRLLVALDRLTKKIEEVAALRPQLTDLERRVTRLEERNS
jgi:hypothetical protein